MRAVILVAVMTAVTILLRFLPFLVFRERTPRYIAYLGKVLPSAIIGMLVIYCLKDMNITEAPFGLPELLGTACVIGLQAWKRNAIISILGGTIVYMLLIQVVFI
ncbi:MAG: AzlD domain-containing protein [Lachnospiraceae bacterium]|nr:AzlD domain-containing protein [Lachnospiraceae bacterium]